jgi:hypothetical protein
MTTLSVDATLCPLCGRANQCAMELEKVSGQPQPPCWCTTTRFDAALLARVPADRQKLACICHRCAQGANQATPT